MRIGRLTRRAQFLRVRGGRSWRTQSFVMLARPQGPKDAAHEGAARIGFTVTKRLGSAVTRNRAKRRLKEAARLAGPSHARTGFDYVVIARRGAVEAPFATLLKEFESAFGRLHPRSEERS